MRNDRRTNHMKNHMKQNGQANECGSANCAPQLNFHKLVIISSIENAHNEIWYDACRPDFPIFFVGCDLFSAIYNKSE